MDNPTLRWNLEKLLAGKDFTGAHCGPEAETGTDLDAIPTRRFDPDAGSRAVGRRLK